MFNNHLSVERIIELEEKLVGEECQNTKEMKYVSRAHSMPFAQIKKAIQDCSNSTSKVDELAFIQDLCERYAQSRKSVLRRIREVKRIDKYKEKQKKKIEFIKKNLFEDEEIEIDDANCGNSPENQRGATAEKKLVYMSTLQIKETTIFVLRD